MKRKTNANGFVLSYVGMPYYVRSIIMLFHAFSPHARLVLLINYYPVVAPKVANDSDSFSLS